MAKRAIQPRRAVFSPVHAASAPVRRSARRLNWAWAIAALLLGLPPAAAFAIEAVANAFEGTDEPADEGAEPAVFLPSDRGRERMLDRGRRLVADGRWSDAATILDELLADEHDAFVDPEGAATLQTSIRTAAEQVIESLPRDGKDAYLLLVRARADRQLATAIATSDSPAILSVARRWFHTPAGHRAAVLAAIMALESGEPLAAANWLERLAASSAAGEFEPSLTFMRALARHQAGDTEAAADLLAANGQRLGGIAQLGGREESLSAAAAQPRQWLSTHGTQGWARPTGGDWSQLRGSPARNTIAEASRPLLVPRYRVPLVRHPDEARQLEKQRRAAADTGRSLIPAGTPLAVGAFLVAHTPLGILAVDFDSGRRLWLASSVPAGGLQPDDDTGDFDGRLRPAAHELGDSTFDDATSGNLASDGQLVFAVESPPESLVSEITINGFGRGFLRMAPDWHAGNMLSAFDLGSQGELRWQLPRDSEAENPEADTDNTADNQAASWYLGGPLVIGDELLVLVEQQGEVRLDVLAAADGKRRWSQPLATYDDDESIVNPVARSRRLAGLTPAAAEGIVVCPVGGGCIVAVEAASRSLLWAHSYRRARAAIEATRAEDTGDPRTAAIQRCDPCPVIAQGRVLVTPHDAETLLCLEARTGKALWSVPSGQHLRIAGVVRGQVIVTGQTAVEAIDLQTGRPTWRWPYPEGTRPSGRGILTGQSLLQPLDSPEVVEIALADGRLTGRSPARGGTIPGNLVPHRGEIVSQGIESLDVFHQEAALDERIETAFEADPHSPWARFWRAQAAIEEGDVAKGLDWLAEVAASPRFRIPPGGVAEAVERAMRRDFAAVMARWRTLGSAADVASAAPEVARMMVDGFLAAGDAEAAWDVCHGLLTMAPRAVSAEELFRDPTDPALTLAPDRWLRSRLTRITAAAPQALADRITASCKTAVATAAAAATPQEQHRELERLVEQLGRHPTGADAIRRLMGASAVGSEPAIRRELLGLQAPTPPASALATLDTVASAWPLGRVECQRLARAEADGIGAGGMQAIPIQVVGGGAPDARVAQAVFANGDRSLLVTDQLGRAVASPISIGESWGRAGLPWINGAALVDVAALGRLLFVRTIDGLNCYDLDAGRDAESLLWSRRDFARTSGLSGFDRLGGGVGGRVSRDGSIPLGMRIVEPEDPARGGGRGLLPLAQGLIVPGTGSVAFLDPATGHVFWERHRVPQGSEWIADANSLCGCTADGRGSIVLSLDDGRLLETHDLPNRRQRLATAGRRIVTVHSLDELPGRFTARQVRLDLVDPVGHRTVSLGEFSGDSRAVETGDGRLAVLAPDGELAVFDLADATRVFVSVLPEPPARLERLVVQAWHDRYLVLAGCDDHDQVSDISPLQSLLAGLVMTLPQSISVWAVDRHDGGLLWPGPARIERQYLLETQPPAAPILIFCRLLESETTGGERRLSVLAIDKRTGQAVVEDEQVPIRPPLSFGCRVIAEADTHSVTIGGEAGSDRLKLTFTGQPPPIPELPR